MIDKIVEGDAVEALCGVDERCIVDVVNGCRELIAGDGGNNQVSVPHLVFGKVCSPSHFASGCRGRCVGGVFRRSSRGNGESRPVALKIKDGNLEEAQVSFAMAPWARNGHEIGGEFFFNDF